MRLLKVTEPTNIKMRLAGTFFFSRKHTKRSTSGNFRSVQKDVHKAIHENPAVQDPDKSLHDQMKALFHRPLWHLRFRLSGCLPPVFVINGLDECEPKVVADLISLLGEVLRDPELPVIHILLTSRLEEHIRKAIQTEEMRLLVCEIPDVRALSGAGGVESKYDTGDPVVTKTPLRARMTLAFVKVLSASARVRDARGVG
ncbi:uncharacterized protein BJ212DRAFT_1359146 [Suillus subaureus]|uniref:Nephrocystin 3-like N-terminal domain-containing protein n=1 Tax=Suillus subaureus TaxID=48587 RepID=A0A9P7JCW2_9AGAM|nr:uncharacterized protein BJ212DRAFT_1359146 [Suillus subaureus]KAG1815052.1 hypothetical protein BJ212DRAFT_1359146 [Suillus subaureus]